MTNVYKFPDVKISVRPDPTITLAADPGEFCKHYAVELNSHQRTVTCKLCKAVVDPFEFISSVAKLIARAATELKFIKNEKEYVAKELEELKKEAKNLKLQVKRVKPRLKI